MVTASDLTVEEQAVLVCGAGFWTTTALEPYGIESLWLSDGPNGLRKQDAAGDHLGMGASLPATCFPPAVALGSTFDPDLVERVGTALGREAAALDVSVLLAPGINIKRSPLCGRNFEYVSEDPLVSGVLGAALVRGIQSQGVGASLKHFAANNQEADRLRVSADVDPRPLREIYLRAFERVVREAQPWTVMCSYNRVNGVPASENRWLLTSVLRDDWGFEGVVVSDWGAVGDRVAALAAGLDLEMPSSGGRSSRALSEAVAAGSLDAAALETAAQRMLDLVVKADRRPAAEVDLDAQHALAREVAGRSIVMLRNEGGLLPLSPAARVAVLGAFAVTPRIQGAGSSAVEPTRVSVPLDEIKAVASDVTYTQGFTLDGSGDTSALTAEAVAAAASAEVAVVFLGLPAADESEGYDREHLDLPAAQLELLDAVLAVRREVVVVLSNGGVVTIPFADRVPAILEGWLLGQAAGGAIADVLFGAVNPSGRLAETIPMRLQDTPSYGSFPGEHGHVRYGEGLLVGYRGYDARSTEVAFPFGHGLSYATFDYGPPTAALDGGDVVVRVPVSNTSEVDGREVVQIYSSLPGSAVQRAPRELAAFASVPVAAGETVDVELVVRRADLAYWDVRADRWVVEGGTFRFDVGASSRDLRGTATLEVEGDPLDLPLTLDSTLAEVFEHPIGGPLVRRVVGALAGGDDSPVAALLADEQTWQMISSFPVSRIATMGVLPVEPQQVSELLETINGMTFVAHGYEPLWRRPTGLGNGVES